MEGVITTRDLFINSAVIVHEFGARCFCRCVWRALTSGRPVTFLECACARAPGAVTESRAFSTNR
jgi:hypothetical protein